MKSPRFYYGWIIVAIAFVSMGFWFGIRSNFGVFYAALLEDFGWNRAGSAGVQSLAMLTYTVMAPLAGGLIDRCGPRRIIVPGIFVLCAGLLLCATIKSLPQFYLYYGLIVGTGATSIGIVCYSAIMAHWFEKKRGFASGVAVSGMGLGTFVWVYLAQYLISLWDWRTAFAVLALLYLVILVPLNLWLLRHKPEDLGLQVDGNSALSRKNSLDPVRPAPAADWTIWQVLKSGRFWALMSLAFFSVFAVYVVMVHSVKFLMDIGIDKMTAALILALTGVVSSIFRIFWGWLSDRIGREPTYTLGMAFGCLGAGALLMLASTQARFFAYGFFVFFGMGWGVAAPIFMAASADLFKGRVYGLVYGLIEGAIGAAGALGAWLGGFIFDRTGSYHGAFVLVLLAFGISTVFVWLAAPRKYRHPASELSKKI
ncbi:MAG: MFS transporter [Desulfobacterales bacterium]|nr:MAG: MFS transporter [Desulfobacterales bacterium]